MSAQTDVRISPALKEKHWGERTLWVQIRTEGKKIVHHRKPSIKPLPYPDPAQVYSSF
jgi:hypothetical protein